MIGEVYKIMVKKGREKFTCVLIVKPEVNLWNFLSNNNKLVVELLQGAHQMLEKNSMTLLQ